MANKEETHYVLIMEVIKITKTIKETPSGARWEETKKEELKRDATDIAKFTIKDNNISDLKERGKSHIDLVEDSI